MVMPTTLHADEGGRKDVSVLGLVLVVLTPSIGGFVYGYDLGATSFVLELLTTGTNSGTSSASDEAITHHHHHHHHHPWWHDMNHVQEGLFVAGLSLGALIGSHIVFCWLSGMDGNCTSISRRMEIRICAVLYLLGTFMNVLSGTVFKEAPNWLGFGCLILGRLLFGVGVGFIMHGAPTYMAEMVPASVRGSVVTAKEAFIVTGIVVGYGVGDWVTTTRSSTAVSDDQDSSWTHLYALTTIVTLPFLALTFLIPRSMRWLLSKGFNEEALESMKFVSSKDSDVRSEFEDLKQQILQQQELQQAASAIPEERRSTAEYDALMVTTSAKEVKKTASISVFDSGYRRSLYTALGLVVLQQCSGQPSIISYVTVLFSAAGLSGDSSVYTALYMICNVTFTVWMVDRIGRKSLLKTGCVVMAAALVVLSITFWEYHPDDTDQSSYFGQTSRVLILLSMFLFIGSYQLGFGPITWLIVAEIFPLHIRGEATAFLVELNYTLNFLVQFLFPIIQSSIGWGPTFLVFCLILVLAIQFIHYNVPETKGMTLEEIEQRLFQNHHQQQPHRNHGEEGLPFLENDRAASDDSPLFCMESTKLLSSKR